MKLDVHSRLKMYNFGKNVWVLVLFLISATMALECPRKFQVITLEGKRQCVGAMLSQKRPDGELCKDRLPVESIILLNGSKVLFGVEKLWVDARRSYPGGPVIDWRPGGRFGEPMLSPGLWKDDDANHDCLVYDMKLKNYSVASCDERQDLLCLTDTYGVTLERESCNSNFYYLASPFPTCITKKQLLGPSSRKELEAYCSQRNSHLLEGGFIYTNHHFLLDGDSRDVIVPLGINATTESFYCNSGDCKVNFYYVGKRPLAKLPTPIFLFGDYYHMEGNSTKQYKHVFCEQDVNARDKLIFSPRRGYLLVSTMNNARIDKVVCFTDSESYYPKRVQDVKIDLFTMAIVTKQNGLYWCFDTNPKSYVKESKRVLWIEDEELAKTSQVLQINLDPYYWRPSDESLSFEVNQLKLEDYWGSEIEKVLFKILKTETVPKYRYKVSQNGTVWVLLENANRIDPDSVTNKTHTILLNELRCPSSGVGCENKYLWKYLLGMETSNVDTLLKKNLLMRQQTSDLEFKLNELIQSKKASNAGNPKIETNNPDLCIPKSNTMFESITMNSSMVFNENNAVTFTLHDYPGLKFTLKISKDKKDEKNGETPLLDDLRVNFPNMAIASYEETKKRITFEPQCKFFDPR